MRLQQRLDLGGRDVLAGAADDVLLAVDEMQHAVGVLPHGVAGVEPAAAPGLRGRGLVLQIAGEKAAGAASAPNGADHLARLAVAARRCRASSTTRTSMPGTGTAERARADLPRRHVVEQDAHHLGHAPHLDQRKAEALLEHGMQLRLDAGADAEAHRMRRAPPSPGGWPSSSGTIDAEIMHDGRARLASPRCHQRADEKRSGWIWQLPVEHRAVERHDRRSCSDRPAADCRCDRLRAERREAAARSRTRRRRQARSRATGRSPSGGRSCRTYKGCSPRSRR